MNGRPEAKVLLMQLSERVSGKGTRYFTGYLGKAKLVAFLDQEPDRFGNPQWWVYASEPAPRGDGAVADSRPGFFDTNKRARERPRAGGQPVNFQSSTPAGALACKMPPRAPTRWAR